MNYFKCILYRNILVPFLIILISSCSSKETSGEMQDNTPPYKKIAEEKFDKDYRVIFNNDSTYLIVYYLPKNVNKTLIPPLKFFVYDTNNKKVIFQDNLTNGKVEWINDHQFQVSTIPEIVTGNDEDNKKLFGYIYDVHTKRKLSNEDINK